MRYRNFFLVLCAIVVIARLFQIRLLKRSSLESPTAPSVTPLILPVVKRGLQEDYCHIYEGVFSTATKALDSTTEFISEHVDSVQDAVEDGYFWAVSRLNHAVDMLRDVMMDIYLAPELEWCIFWSVLDRYLHQKQQQQQQQKQKQHSNDETTTTTTTTSHNKYYGDGIKSVVTLGEKYEMNWNQIVCSAPLEYGLRAPQLQQDFRKLASSAIVKTRHMIQANQVHWLHTVRGIQQSVMDAHSHILAHYEKDESKVINKMRTSRRRLKRLVRRQMSETQMRSLRSFHRLDKTIHRMFHDAGMTPIVDTSSQVVCLDELRQQIMHVAHSQYEHGIGRIVATGKSFGDAVMDTLETSLTVFVDGSGGPLVDGAASYYRIGVNGTDVMVTTVPMVIYSSMKRVDVDLATLAQAATDISQEMEVQLCASWEAASQQMSRSEYTWYQWLHDWWYFLKFALWVALKVIVSFF